MSDSLKWILLGLLTIVFGVVVLGNTVVASLAIATLTGTMLLAGGIMQFIGGFSVEGMGAKAFTWLTGAMMAFLGWSFLSHPLAGMISLSVLILILLAAGGIARIIYSFRMRGTHRTLFADAAFRGSVVRACGHCLGQPGGQGPTAGFAVGR
jgi:uncharacterized membrane protein HdeD (DUF308 family)